MADTSPSSATVARIVLTVAGVLLLLYGLYLVRSILVLVIVAMFLAVGLDPVVRQMGRLKISRGVAVFVVLVAALVFAGGFVASVTPPLVRQTQSLSKRVPVIVRDLSTRNQRFEELDKRYDVQARLRDAIEKFPSVVGGSADELLGVARGLGRAIFSILTVLILTVYFLIDLPGLLSGATRLMPPERRARFSQVSDVVYKRISGYMLGQLTVSAAAGITSFVFLTVLGVPYSVPLAMWVALSALIPMVGSSLGAIPSVVVAFFTSVTTGVVTVVFFIAYQQLENYVISPRIMRRAVDISAAAVILAALVGATLLGFVGALLAIPIAASIKVLVQEIWIEPQDNPQPASTAT